MIVSKKMSLGILVLGMFACTNTENTVADKRTVKEIETTDIQLIKTDAKSLSLEIAWQSDSILPTNESVCE
jgi:hypothetical protein